MAGIKFQASAPEEIEAFRTAVGKALEGGRKLSPLLKLQLEQLGREMAVDPMTAAEIVDHAALEHARMERPSPNPATAVTGTISSTGVPVNRLVEAVAQAEAGVTLQLLPQTYEMKHPLVIERGISLHGAPEGGTRLLSRTNGPVLKFVGDRDLGLRSIVFEHSGRKWGDGVCLTSGQVYIERCQFQGAVQDRFSDRGGMGLRLEGHASAHVVASIFERNACAGIWVQSARELEVQDCVCRNNGACGLVVRGSTSCELRRIASRENQGHGMWIADESRVMIETCHCIQNYSSGVLLSDHSICTIRGSRFGHNQAHGIRIEDYAIITLDGNTCVENGESGIVVTGNATGAVHRNGCSRNQQHGIYIAAHARPVLEYNVADGNRDSGIGVFDSAGGTCRLNNCSRNQFYGIYLAGRTRSAVLSNVCSFNGVHGLAYYEEAGGPACGNRSHGNGIHGLWVSASACPELEENTCTGNGGANVLDQR